MQGLRGQKDKKNSVENNGPHTCMLPAAPSWGPNFLFSHLENSGETPVISCCAIQAQCTSTALISFDEIKINAILLARLILKFVKTETEIYTLPK